MSTETRIGPGLSGPGPILVRTSSRRGRGHRGGLRGPHISAIASRELRTAMSIDESLASEKPGVGEAGMQPGPTKQSSAACRISQVEQAYFVTAAASAGNTRAISSRFRAHMSSFGEGGFAASDASEGTICKPTDLSGWTVAEAVQLRPSHAKSFESKPILALRSIERGFVLELGGGSDHQLTSKKPIFSAPQLHDSATVRPSTGLDEFLGERPSAPTARETSPGPTSSQRKLPEETPCVEDGAALKVDSPPTGSALFEHEARKSIDAVMTGIVNLDSNR